MKKILILHTGGTISMQENKETGGVTTSDQNPLHQWDGIASKNVDIISEDAFHLPSPHITSEHMLSLFQLMNKRLQETNADGVVITHGTDSLEETAYAIDLLHNNSTPVVFTGAMRSSNEVSSDGPYNFITAVQTAANENVQGAGVLVVMNEHIHLAKYVTKSHSSNIASFQSPMTGPIGEATKHEIFLYQQPSRIDEFFNISYFNKKVLLMKTYAGMEEDVFQHIISQPLDGVVIEAMGQGNVPSSLLKPIQSLIKQQIPVVIATRCFSGSVHAVYSYEGGGQHLKEMGVIFAHGLNGPKARLKLMAALESSFSLEEMKHSFEKK
ncbi:asparaginase [Salibacterium salarium]|uniref:asparaginase n=1 Tax=Salibacterium salarium TaxID=284579 RepID=A0A428N6A0_9BACI|nr:asparaginase [Salibacterium salarium]RSL33848.1 asparaginase [Salibacterium salarium]